MARAPRPQRGEIWTVQFDPSIGAEIRKLRPAVVANAIRLAGCRCASLCHLQTGSHHSVYYPGSFSFHRPRRLD